MESFFSVRDLTARWGCSRAHVYNQIALGRLPKPMKLGRRSLWARHLIEAAEAKLLAAAARTEPLSS